MEESILRSIAELVGVQNEDDGFDPALVIHINTMLNILHRLGVGDGCPFAIHGADETWHDFLGDDEQDLETVKTYVYLRVKKVFDPPVSSIVLQAMDANIQELEWSINDVCERKKLQ